MRHTATPKDAMKHIGEGLAASQRQRLEDDPAARLWMRAIEGFNPDDVIAEFDKLQIDTEDFLRPAMLRKRLIALRAVRLSNAGDPPPPAVDPDDAENYRTWIAVWRSSIGNGATRDDATQVADQWAQDNGCHRPGLRGTPVPLPARFAAQLAAATSMPASAQESND